jgi:hypothetical protein
LWKDSALLSNLKNCFLLTSGCDTVLVSFEARLIPGRLPPRLILAQNVLRKLRLSSLANGVVYIKQRLTYITNEVLTSRHECKFDMIALDLDRRRCVANCKLYSRLCLNHPPNKDLLHGKILFCSKSSHNLGWNNQCQCKLSVKTSPASLKSLCVNKLGRLPSKYHKYKFGVCKTQLCIQ